MSRDPIPEIRFEWGRAKVLAKGCDAIQAIKWPLRAILCAVAFLILALSITGHFAIPALGRTFAGLF
jgi:hypothetical protein